jgi:hypothetical protein
MVVCRLPALYYSSEIDRAESLYNYPTTYYRIYHYTQLDTELDR